MSVSVVPKGKRKFGTNLEHDICDTLCLKARARGIHQSELLKRLIKLLDDPEIDARV